MYVLYIYIYIHYWDPVRQALLYGLFGLLKSSRGAGTAIGCGNEEEEDDDDDDTLQYIFTYTYTYMHLYTI